MEYRLLGEVKRRSKAKGLTEQGADISMFKPDTAAEDITVERYYSQKYRMPNGAGFRQAPALLSSPFSFMPFAMMHAPCGSSYRTIKLRTFLREDHCMCAKSH